jgi:hypothetical protein
MTHFQNQPLQQSALAKYADQKFLELNPHAATSAGHLSVSEIPGDIKLRRELMNTPIVRTALPGTIQEKIFHVYFYGSLDDFEKNPALTSWSASGENTKMIGAGVNSKEKENANHHNSEEWVTLSDGSTGRLLLRDATVISTQNTSSLPIGLTISNLPTNSEVFSGKGPSQFHVIIPPHVQTPIPENQRIFVDHVINHDNDYVNGLLYDGRRSTLTKTAIESSIINRPKPGEEHLIPAWTIKIGSHMFHKVNELAQENGPSNEETMFTVIDQEKPHNSVALVDNATALKAYTKLYDDLKHSPFHLPSTVGAKISREDKLAWTDPSYNVNEGKKFGEDPNFKSKAFLKNKETIGVRIKATYQVCKVDADGFQA